MLHFEYGLQPYVRRVRVSDVASVPVEIFACFGGTVINTAVDGLRGHSSFKAKTNAFGTLFAFTFGVLLPNVQTLRQASDALCGGDIEFVSTVDGAGVPAWAYPDTATPSVVAARGFPHGEPPTVTRARKRALPSGAKFYSERVFDVVAQQFGKDAQQDECSDDAAQPCVLGRREVVRAVTWSSSSLAYSRT